jgi:hypothetical protein
MPLASYGDKTIFFAHVPKTGGSSVEDYLIQRFGPLSIIDKNKRTGVRGTGLIVPATHLAAVDVMELVPHDLTYSFAVVRDPLTRIMSEYRYQTNVSRMSRLGFSTWLHVMLAAVRSEPRLYENHIRRQSDLVPDDAEIFRLEDGFDTLIAKLDQVTGKPVPGLTVGHLNTRKHGEITLSRQDVALIADYYSADYRRFGYPQPDLTAYPDINLAAPRKALARVLAVALVRKQRHDWVR